MQDLYILKYNLKFTMYMSRYNIFGDVNGWTSSKHVKLLDVSGYSGRSVFYVYGAKMVECSDARWIKC